MPVEISTSQSASAGSTRGVPGSPASNRRVASASANIPNGATIAM